MSEGLKGSTSPLSNITPPDIVQSGEYMEPAFVTAFAVIDVTKGFSSPVYNVNHG